MFVSHKYCLLFFSVFPASLVRYKFSSFIGAKLTLSSLHITKRDLKNTAACDRMKGNEAEQATGEQQRNRLMNMMMMMKYV